jgi:DNA primase
LISKEDINTILEAVRIEEIIGEYVKLKRRGVNLIGLCPFHNEKTPSFTVSSTKGIFKCFGCGKSGDALTFLMEHEHFTYPEALRFLAQKYNISIKEETQDNQNVQEKEEKESLYQITAFANKFFVDKLWNSNDGKAIGLTYFRERGFSDIIIKKFELGYCSAKWDEFTEFAKKNGYKSQLLVKSGLSIEKDFKYFDRFKERVIFPIHSLSGKVIGFGGRIIGSDKSKSKYINSPETKIYNKSKVLYGLYFAKNAIVAKDNCFLVEGYTDVISLYQAGIENVVASSGTSLTTEQIRLIGRYTKSITILYDGDTAGIKASFRGIDMILEEGLNVKIVLFPENEDPDSFVKKNRSSDVVDFIEKNSKNFILFKTQLLFNEASNDPIKMAALINEIVGSISLIPNSISRSIYIKECSNLLKIPEQTLINELNKILRKKTSKTISETDIPAEKPPLNYEDINENIFIDDAFFQEREIIRLLLNFSNRGIKVITEEKTEDSKTSETKIKTKEPSEKTISVAEYIINDILNDEIKFNNETFQKIFELCINEVEKGSLNFKEILIHHNDKEIKETSIDLMSTQYILSDYWEKLHQISVQTEESNKILEKAVTQALFSYKLKRIEKMLKDNSEEIKNSTSDDDLIILIEKQKKLEEIKKDLSSKLGRIIIR